MSIEIIRPNGAGAATNLTAQDPTLSLENWECVAESSADTDTYVYNNTSTLKNDLYELENHVNTGISINSITLYAYCKKVGSSTNNHAFPLVYLSGVTVTGTQLTLTTGWASYSQAMSRPGGGAWVEADLDALQAGIRARARGVGGESTQISQVYISIDYTVGNAPPSVPTLVLPTNHSTEWKTQPSLTTNSVTGTGTITLQLQVDTENTFANPVTTEVSGITNSVTTGTGWQVPIELTPNTTYYWRARSNNGLDSDWSTISDFTIGIFPAPTGLQCEKSSSTPVEANGYPCFSAVYLGAAAGGLSNATAMQVAMVSGGNNFDSPLISSSWESISSLSSGTRSPLLIYSGSLSSYYNNSFSGLNWAIRFRNAGNVYSYWGSGHSFYMNRKPWELPEKGERRKISFGDHPTIPSGFTATMNMDTGTAELIAENLPVESIPDAFTNVVYANGKTHVTYLGDYDPASSGFTIYIVTKDHSTNTWGEPYFVDSAYTSNDTHHVPAMCVDNYGYIHLFYGTHSTYTAEQLKYKRSVQPNKTGSGDDGTWTTVSSIAYPATYSFPLVTRDNDIYVLFRTSLEGAAGGAGTEADLGYIKSTDGGDSWSSIYFIASGYQSGRTYMHGQHWDRKNNRFHAAISFLDNQLWAHGVWYAYTDDFTTWKTVSGTTCGIASTNTGVNTLMTPSGTSYIPSVVIYNSGVDTQYFCRPIVVDKDNNPHVFFNSERSSARFYHHHFLADEQTHYFQIPILHSRWDGANWQTVDITSQINTGVWAPNYSFKPLIDKDNNIILYINEKPVRDYTIQPTISGTHSDFLSSAGATFSAINYHNYLYQTSSYIYSNSTNAESTFSGVFSAVPTGYISCVQVESICKKNTSADLIFCHTLLISGVLYSGSMFSWRDIYDGGNWIYRTELPYIYRWYTNPHTKTQWVRSDLDTIQFGISKIGATQLECYDLVCRVEAINNTHNNHYAGEVVKLLSRDNGSTWLRENITNYSSRGVPQLSLKGEFSNNQLEMVWATANKLYYYNQNNINHFNNDGSDIRVLYGSTEIDRVSDRWNNDNTSISFKIQEEIPSGYPYANKDYYIYNLDVDSTYAKDNPKNIYKFYETFEEYPALQLFPSVKVEQGNITKNIAVYQADNEDTYNALYDLKNDSSVIASGVFLRVMLSAISTPSISEAAEFTLRFSNSATYDSTKVTYTGLYEFNPVAASGVYEKYIYLPNLTLTSGSSMKIDFHTLGIPANSGSINRLWVDELYYMTAVSGWQVLSGMAFIADSAPYGPAYPFAGGKALRIGGAQAGLYGGKTILQKTVGTGINNVYLEFAINAMRQNEQSKRSILLSSPTQVFGIGINLSTQVASVYRQGPVYYTSGTTDFDTNYSGLGDQAWHRFKILVRDGLCDAWWGDNQVCTGINALSDGFSKITISGNVFDMFDYIKMYDYISEPLEITEEPQEYKCINFTAAIQGKQNVLIGFNYIIDQHYVDYKSNVPYEWFYTVFMDKKVSVGNTSSQESKFKISDEYMSFIDSYNKCDVEWTQLFDGSKSKFNIESTSSLDTFAKFSLEYTEAITLDSKVTIEYLQNYETSTKIDLDYTTLVHLLCKFLSGNSSSIEAHSKIFAENTLFIVALTKLANGYFASIAIDNKLNIDDLSIVENNFKICSDYIKNIEKDSTISIDYGLAIDVFCKIVSGYLKLLEADSSVIPSWLQSIAADFKINTDNLTSILSADSKYSTEFGLSAIRLIKVPEDYLTTIDILHKIPFEWLGELVVWSDLKIPVSYLGSMEYKSNFPLENLQASDAVRKACFEYKGTLSVDSKINIDNLSSIISDTEYSIDNLNSIVTDIKTLCESCISVLSNNNVPINYLGSINSDTKIGVDNLGTAVITIDNKIPVDFTASIDSLLKVDIEHGLINHSSYKIANDVLSNVELFTNIPLDVLSNIYTDIKFNSDTIYDIEYTAKLPEEYKKSLACDYIVPLEYTADGIFTSVGIKIPMFWMSSIENDNKANIEFTSEVSSVSSDCKILIDYGISVESYSKFEPEFQSVVRSMAKVINGWCSTVGASAKISISSISNVDKFITLDIEFGTGVIAQSKIPIEAMKRIIADYQFPITSIGGALIPLFFKNITFLVPEISSFHMEIPVLQDILMKMIEPIIETTKSEAKNIEVKSPEAEVTISGQSV